MNVFAIKCGMQWLAQDGPELVVLTIMVNFTDPQLTTVTPLLAVFFIRCRAVCWFYSVKEAGINCLGEISCSICEVIRWKKMKILKKLKFFSHEELF